jgi:hypothetical protein
MSTVAAIRKHINAAKFGPPCADDQIAEVEGRLGCRLPGELRELYYAFDGFRGPGNAQYLFPLLKCADGGSSLLDMTLQFRDCELLDLSQFIFFGSTTADECLGHGLSEPTRIIRYHHHMEKEFEPAGANILEAYLADMAKWREISDA